VQDTLLRDFIQDEIVFTGIDKLVVFFHHKAVGRSLASCCVTWARPSSTAAPQTRTASRSSTRSER
jgi:hypothetical protein